MGRSLVSDRLFCLLQTVANDAKSPRQFVSKTALSSGKTVPQVMIQEHKYNRLNLNILKFSGSLKIRC
jgi:hypothetical protein